MSHWKIIVRGLGIVLICPLILIIIFFLIAFWGQNRLVFPGGGQTNRYSEDLIPSAGTPDNFLVPLQTRSGHATVMWVRRPNNEHKGQESHSIPTSSTTLAGVASPVDGHEQDDSSLSQKVSKIDGPVLLFFYGNGGCLAWCDNLTQRLSEMGVTAAVVEYVGYGASSGKPSERLCYESACAAYDYFVEQAGLSPDKIIVAGHSLGAAVACDLASRKPVGKLVMLSGFTTLADAAAIHFPWLPVRTLLSYRFDSSSKIPRIEADILFLHGENDEIVPVGMSRTNFAIARERVCENTQKSNQYSNNTKTSQLILFPAAYHNLFEEIPDKVYSEMEKFIFFPKKDDPSPLKKNGNRVN